MNIIYYETVPYLVAVVQWHIQPVHKYFGHEEVMHFIILICIYCGKLSTQWLEKHSLVYQWCDSLLVYSVNILIRLFAMADKVYYIYPILNCFLRCW